MKSFLTFLIVKDFLKALIWIGLTIEIVKSFSERKEKIENSYLNHPNTALKNAQEYFNIDENIASAITTHMFHHVVLKKIFPFINRKEKVNFKENKPTNKESWIVCISDLLVSIMECQRFEFSYIANLSYLIILNIIFIKH